MHERSRQNSDHARHSPRAVLGREVVGIDRWATADGNNNISPGQPRTFRLTAIAKF
jgi:hypothetical protein